METRQISRPRTGATAKIEEGDGLVETEQYESKTVEIIWVSAHVPVNRVRERTWSSTRHLLLHRRLLRHLRTRPTSTSITRWGCVVTRPPLYLNGNASSECTAPTPKACGISGCDQVVHVTSKDEYVREIYVD